MRARIVVAALAAVLLAPASAGAETAYGPGSVDSWPLDASSDPYGAIRAELNGGRIWTLIGWDQNLALAVYDGSGGARVWGLSRAEEPEHLQYTPVSSREAWGVGTPDDPRTQRTIFRAGDVLEVTQLLRVVDGTNRLLVRYDVRNISGAGVRFRASSSFDLEDGPALDERISCSGPLRCLGFKNRDGSSDGGSIDDGGIWGRVEEVEGSPWSRWQQDQRSFLMERIADPMSAGFTNAVAASDDDAMGAQWDQHGLSGTPLASGATARFEVAIRTGDPILINPRRASPCEGGTHTKRISTAFAHGGGAGVLVGYRLTDNTGSLTGFSGMAHTDAGGELSLTWRQHYGYENLQAWIERNGDGVWQPFEETFHRSASAIWRPTWAGCTPENMPASSSGTSAGTGTSEAATPSLTPTVADGTTSTQPAAPLATVPALRSARLRVTAATLRGRRLRLTGRIAARAPVRLSITVRVAGRTVRRTVRHRAGRWSTAIRLPVTARRAVVVVRSRRSAAYAGGAVRRVVRAG